MVQLNISFAGAGRVAGALCRAMYQAGHNIGLVVSESEKNGIPLAESCKAIWSHKLIFPDSTDVIIVAVPDHRLKAVLNSIICRPEALVAHTAGSMGFEVFPDNLLHKGIFYPLQTFSPARKVAFLNLPFLLETSDEQTSPILKNLAESIGGIVHFVDTENRRKIHIAGVFVCNFTNHMLTVGKEVSRRAGVSFDLLGPLIKETFSKALDLGPEYSQTGPAVRNDQNTIEKHLELLSFSPELQRIYQEMTRSIINYYNKSL